MDLTGAMRLKEDLPGHSHAMLEQAESADWPNRDQDAWEGSRPGHYFVMGDNRDNSLDSRYWIRTPYPPAKPARQGGSGPVRLRIGSADEALRLPALPDQVMNSELRGMTVKRNQSGMSLSGFLTLLVVVIFFLYIGMKLFPIYQGYFAVRSVMKDMAIEAKSGSSLQPAQLQEDFFRRLYINYSDDALKRDDIKFQQIENGWRMRVEYETRRPLIGNLDVVGYFDTSEDLIRNQGGN